MRHLLAPLLLALIAHAEPPAADFSRLKGLRDDLRDRIAELQQQEEFNAKPREERMLIAFGRGDPKFEAKELGGKAVVKACLAWADLCQARPTEAGRRVMELLPKVMRERYAVAVNRKERRDVSSLLVEALDSEFLPVRQAVIDSLKAIYGVPGGFNYDPTLAAKGNSKAIKEWRRYVAARNS